MRISGGFLTTAMAVMPHRDVDQALALALTMDVPFWPQLPNLSYHEDMYVPTGVENFGKETLNTLVAQLEDIWSILCKKGLDMDRIIDRSMVSPATCCLVNPDGGATVEKAFALINALSDSLKEKYKVG
ncbi:MAG: hypothetical protein KKD44_17010 [Proteobacteria bacterium]|nr:hypothetical protein [Pseudomonadota bacterium]